MQSVMDEHQIAAGVARLAEAIARDAAGRGVVPALIGIRSRGEVLAARVGAAVAVLMGRPIDVGILDISFYRDDLRQRHTIVIPRGTVVPFAIDDRCVILIDDVLETGRSVRAALDALTDFGRPGMIKLFVLVDRGNRELPIAADEAVLTLDLPADERVVVRLKPTDPEDAVYREGAKHDE
jgi:pyrimidine operon attenuation protein/uracil phosphoribosyltransferase